MNRITHHPSDETLAAFAAGTLDEPRRIVVGAHVSLCRRCRKTVEALEFAGGLLIDEADPAEMADDALSRALSQLDAEQPPQRDEAGGGAEMPSLAGYELGRWLWVGPGVYRRAIKVRGADGTKAFMLRAAPGTRLPHHRHSGIEWTCVIQGAFEHQLGRFGAGDFDEADETMEHTPVVAAGEPCICIVALQGGIELQSRLGRLIQPLLRI